MKRGKPLKRRTELNRATDRAREFLRKRGGLERQGGMRRASKAEGPLSPREWRERVFEASGGRCLLSGARARDVDDPRFAAHHPVPKRVLRERRLFDRVWDARNAVWITADVHERHENASARIPAEKLPRSVWEFCAELDALEGTEWATVLVLRAHPPAGHSRDLSRRGGRYGEG